MKNTLILFLSFLFLSAAVSAQSIRDTDIPLPDGYYQVYSLNKANYTHLAEGLDNTLKSKVRQNESARAASYKDNHYKEALKKGVVTLEHQGIKSKGALVALDKEKETIGILAVRSALPTYLGIKDGTGIITVTISATFWNKKKMENLAQTAGPAIITKEYVFIPLVKDSALPYIENLNNIPLLSIIPQGKASSLEVLPYNKGSFCFATEDMLTAQRWQNTQEYVLEVRDDILQAVNSQYNTQRYTGEPLFITTDFKTLYVVGFNIRQGKEVWHDSGLTVKGRPVFTGIKYQDIKELPQTYKYDCPFNLLNN